jgi:hypothetical protein
MPFALKPTMYGGGLPRHGATQVTVPNITSSVQSCERHINDQGIIDQFPKPCSVLVLKIIGWQNETRTHHHSLNNPTARFTPRVRRNTVRGLLT